VAILGLLGHPLGHSLSPELLDPNLQRYYPGTEYRLLDLPPEDFERRFLALPGEGFLGCNVTIPYKTAAARLCHDLDRHARRSGAVNCVHFKGGQIRGYNTDVEGVRASLLRYTHIPASALVLGAGGVARGVLTALEDLGVDRVTVLTRRPEAAEGLKELFPQVKFQPFERVNDRDFVGTWDLLVNCTPVGMHPKGGQSPLPKSPPASVMVLDTVYNPSPTRLVAEARASGCEAMDGLHMLATQAAHSLKIWFELPKPPVSELWQRAITLCARQP
jgi:shikimate dehydrogenase